MKRRFAFKSVVALANSKLSIKLAASILAASTLISALLGVFRDRLLNSYYLDTYPTGIDAYTAAFTVPDFMFFLLVSGALSVSFVPVFNQRLATGNKKSAWELSSSILNLLALVTLSASVLIMLFADPLVRYVIGPGLDESGTVLAINMMRVIAINPFLFAIATVLSSIQQAVGRFVFYALAPSLYSVGILIGIQFFTRGINLFGLQLFEGGIMGVALGVVFGAVLQVLVSIVGLVGLGFDYEFKIYWKNLGFRSVLRMLPARSLDQCIDYVNSITATNLSSRMGAGSLRSFQQAINLHQMPVNLIGVAIATAYFPKLTEDVGKGEDQEFYQSFISALRMIIFIALPVAIVSFFARGYVASFIKNGGSPRIASTLGALVVAILFRAIFHIASRGFYARQDTKTPLIVSIVIIGLNILLSCLFSLSFNWGIEGLGWAQSICALLEVVVLLTILHKRANHQLFTSAFRTTLLKLAFVSLLTSLTAFLATRFLPLRVTDTSFFDAFPKFTFITFSAFIVYLTVSYLLGIEETIPVFAKLQKIIFRNIKQV